MPKRLFSPRDIEQIKARGASPAALEKIHARLLAPPRFVPLRRAAGLDDGLRVLDESELQSLAKRFGKLDRPPLKFTPMSGAASRMFAFVQRYVQGQDKPGDNEKVQQLIDALDTRTPGPRFAFDQALDAQLRKQGEDLQTSIEAGDRQRILQAIIDDTGLGYAAKPKGLIPFHLDDDGRPVTALQEHMREAIEYAGAKLHLTVSPQHQRAFELAVAEICRQHSELAGVQVSFSQQSPATDSIAIDADTHALLRDDAGQLLFFPAGHGALLHNIEQMANPAVLRNVDNLPRSPRAQQQVRLYHQALAVLLADFKKQRRELLQKIKDRSKPPQNLYDALQALRAQGFHLLLNESAFAGSDDDKKYTLLQNALDRPVKIVGVVPNQGEPGGGPFVVDKQPPFVSIVEKDEIAPQQKT